MKIIKNSKNVKLESIGNLGVYTATYQDQDSNELFIIIAIFFTIMIVDMYEIDIWTQIFDLLKQIGAIR